MENRIAACACGKVEFEAAGKPIASVICCCDDCQEGSRRIEALPGAAPVLDGHGGTPYMLVRKDRVRCLKGEEFLVDYKLKEKSITNRTVAGCCNSAMLIRFDRGPHWVTMYRDRFGDAAPPVQYRISTKFAPDVPDDGIPSYRKFPPALIAKLVGAMFAMMFSRLRGANVTR